LKTLKNPDLSSSKELKHIALKRELEEFVGSSQPGARIPSYTEMIRKYGVGQATIDRVLREFDTEGLIVRKAGKGIFVSPRAVQKRIGFVLGRDAFRRGHSPICSILMDYCQKREKDGTENFKFYLDVPQAATTDVMMSLHQEELSADLQAKRLDGVILVWSHGPDETRWLRSFGVPIVSVGQEGDIDMHSAIIDYTELIRAATEALIAAKCRRIALLTPFGYLRESAYKQDVQVFQSVLTKHGLPFNRDWILEDRQGRATNAGGKLSNEELGFEVASDFLATCPEPAIRHGKLPFDGLVSADDMFTRGALTALHQHSISFKNGLLIATHANRDSPALSGYAKDLILLEVDPVEVIDAMLKLLESMIRGGSKQIKKVYIKPHLIHS